MLVENRKRLRDMQTFNIRRASRFALLFMATRALSLKAASTAKIKLSSSHGTPIFSFGVIADVQWADHDDGYNYGGTVVRKYRGAFATLVRAVDWWNSLEDPPSFIAQLGDLIDGINAKLGQSVPALDAALAQFRRAPCQTVNIVGNHELVGI